MIMAKKNTVKKYFTAENTVDMGCIYDFIPMIREKLGSMCPREDVLREILNVYTTGLLKSINTALRFRYLDKARRFDPSLPTEQEMYDFAKAKEGDPDESDCDDFEDEFVKFLAGRKDILPKGGGFSDLDLYRTALHFNGWQKRQMMKGAVDAEILEFSDDCSTFYEHTHLEICVDDLSREDYRNGDKVKIIIIKED